MVSRNRLIGRIKLKYPKQSNKGWLRVSFFWPFYNDYKIIFLDQNYNIAIVVGSSKKYFWILSKRQQIPELDLKFCLAYLKSLGYDSDKMIISND